MIDKHIEEIKLTDVYHDSEYGRIYLSFNAEDHTLYRMVLLNDTGEFEPVRVYHLSEHCLLCEKTARYENCSYFAQHLNILFQRLIQFPSIRLEWLFIPHVGKDD